jgi:hypothetical protein
MASMNERHILCVCSYRFNFSHFIAENQCESLKSKTEYGKLLITSSIQTEEPSISAKTSRDGRFFGFVEKEKVDANGKIMQYYLHILHALMEGWCIWRITC